MKNKLYELALKSQREGRILYAYDWNSKAYYQIQGVKITRITKAKYEAAQTGAKPVKAGAMRIPDACKLPIRK